ncbi:hypothetical protein [Magnetococcus sp. PR-3]|uniref:hypothetical protein n=1 Tax=Magnetococcus sp. PR-3 TaxID=3120355 RepID=UPI002FCE3A32
MPLSLIILFALGFVVLRILPFWHVRHSGCDAYYFLQCSQVYRQQKKALITLPNIYLLELDEQWYPPGFSIFLGFFPARVVNHYYWLLSTLLDLPIALGIASLLYTTSGPTAAMVGLLLYATIGSTVMEYANLTSRPLGVLLFFMVLIGLVLALQQGLWIGILVASTGVMLLIFTHKLTLQLVFFLLPFMALTQADLRYLLPLPLGYGLALLLHKELVIKIIRAHHDIVTFWLRNINLLKAHAVQDSPIYGTPKDHQENFHHVFKRLMVRMFAYNPWILALVLLAWIPQQTYTPLLLSLVTGIYLWAFLTIFIKSLRGFGEGTKYIKYALPLNLVLVAELLFSIPTWTWPTQLLIGSITLIHLVLYGQIIRQFMQSRTDASGALTPAMQKVIEHLRSAPHARTMCLPCHMSDLLAYHTEKPVLWGTHGYGFKKAEAFFPVLRHSVNQLMETYQLTHLLIDKSYTSTEELQITGQVVVDMDNLQLLAFERPNSQEPKPV